MTTENPVIELRDVRYRWKNQRDDVLCIDELVIQPGQHLFLHGSSGSGKTSLLNLLTGVALPRQGSVKVLGTRLDSLNAAGRDRFRSDHLGVIFQQFNLLPFLSVIDNVRLACDFSPRRQSRVANVELEAGNLLQALHIPADILKKPVVNLSSGQQQRVAVARALIGHPELLIADEPTSALDTDNRDAFLKLLFEQAEKSAATVIFVSHDKSIASYFQRVQAMSDFTSAES